MKAEPTARKLRGGYYTPAFLADVLARWAVRSPRDRVLEPSCGDGAILAAAARALARLGAPPARLARLVLGVELDAGEAAAARRALARPGLAGTVVASDFFGWATALVGAERFDAIVGNPPFIRYQSFPEAQRALAFALMRKAGLGPTRLTNAWVPFVVASTMLLDERGRLAMVVPAELLQVGYAGELRQFLADSFHRVTLVTFRRLVFDGIQQEVVLLCAERAADGPAGIRTIEVDDPSELTRLDRLARTPIATLDHATEKWTRYFLSPPELALVRRLEGNAALLRLGAVAEVDVGVVTGLNEFFVVAAAEARRMGATRHTVPIVTRSAQLSGVRLTRGDLGALEASGARTRLLDLPAVPLGRLPRRVREYVGTGEANGWHEGYKCRNRDPWWKVPSIWTPDAFMLRQVHDFPKMTLNGAGATSTDTVHRVRFRDARKGRLIALGMLNSMTFAFAELVGRSYGGGVLELEPTEAEQLPLVLDEPGGSSLADADAALRAGEVERVLARNDRVLLRGALGLTSAEVDRLRAIRAKLRGRRHARKVKARGLAGRAELLLGSGSDG